MIDPNMFTSSEFQENFQRLELQFVAELEHTIIARLMEQRSIALPDFPEEVIEFAGKTNFKIRIKRPNKNVWSVPLQEFRHAIRQVLREGKLPSLEAVQKAPRNHQEETMKATLLLLHVLPEKEFYKRSFVGNKVVHITLGEGEIVQITETGNVVVDFSDRRVKLKPGFIRFKTGEETSISQSFGN